MKKKQKDYDHRTIEAKWPRKDFSTSSVMPSSSGTPRGEQKEYNHQVIEKKWQKMWEEKKLNQPDLLRAKKPFYNLMMYPYPSAEGLHVGNMYAFTGADIYGRFKRMKGFDVFEPIGVDSGGIHSENYAIKVGGHPKKVISDNVRHYKKQLKMIGAMFDWPHFIDAMDPDYYKWTQWIFVQLFKAGLAYKKEAPVIWCPSCKTTLSDEQTEKLKAPASKAGRQSSKLKADSDKTVTVCERCKTEIEKKNMKQWFFKITDYAERLLENTKKLNWTEKVLIAQRNWIGKSEGAIIEWEIIDGRGRKRATVETFTTRPDTVFGATFLVLAPDHPVVSRLLPTGDVLKYLQKVLVKTEQQRKKGEREKEGVQTVCWAKHPLTGECIPVWIADFVLMDYGRGAVMGVPAHDQRDWQFAKKYKLPIKSVIKGKDWQVNLKGWDDSYIEEGMIINSDPWDGWRYPEDINKVIKWLEDKDCGKKAITYKLRDWCISRQRYWGPPIPMVFCSTCAERGKTYSSTKSEGRMEKFSTSSNNNMAGWYPVPEDQLPVLLPDTDDYLPGEAGGKSPLARLPEFVKTKCPHCGGSAVRETDVSDTFLDSSWYFLAYPNSRTEEFEEIATSLPAYGKRAPRNDKIEPFNKKLTKKWLPVNQYIGGAEHSVLHLMYSRFIWMVLYDLGYFDFSAKGRPASGWEEPFPNFYAHGLIIKDGAKMSKSRGNVVNPDEYIEKYGADALRTYLMFIGPFSQGGDFQDTGMRGMHRFMKKIYRLAMKSCNNQQSTINNQQRKAEDLLAKTTYRIGQDISRFKYNTAIAKLMEFVNVWDKNIQETGSNLAKQVAIVIAPFMPHLAEELWFLCKLKAQSSKLKANWSVHQQPWPKVDEKTIKEEKTLIIVQVNGKLRDKLTMKQCDPKVFLPAKGPTASTCRRVNFRAGNEAMKKLAIKMAKKSERVKKYLKGKTVKRVVFVPGKLINFVVNN